MITLQPHRRGGSRRDFLRLSGVAALGFVSSSGTAASGQSDRHGEPGLPVTLADVTKAQRVIAQAARRTPLVEERALSELSGSRVYLKLEDLQRTGAFKVRGAFNKIADIPNTQRARGVIAASAGNHAQGVALAASWYKIPATIVMPVGVPDIKLQATKAYGARVVLHGNIFDESLAKAMEIQRETGATFVHPFDDPLVIAGQGTIGLEILKDLPNPDIILVPVGGGGLIAGIAVAIKHLRPAAHIIGVEPQNAPSMVQALRLGSPAAVEVLPTLADGTAVAKAGSLTFPIVKELVDHVVTVSEQEIADAIVLLLTKDKVLAEGAGALGAAALLSGKQNQKAKNIVIVVSGGNIDPSRLGQLLRG